MENKIYPQRTLTQNAALHVLFTLLAEELNSAGLDMKKVLKPEVDIPWNPKTVKDWLWRPLMKAQLGLTSTTELNTKNIDDVFDTLNRHLGEKFGLQVDFPSVETIMFKKLNATYSPKIKEKN